MVAEQQMKRLKTVRLPGAVLPDEQIQSFAPQNRLRRYILEVSKTKRPAAHSAPLFGNLRLVLLLTYDRGSILSFEVVGLLLGDDLQLSRPCLAFHVDQV